MQANPFNDYNNNGYGANGATVQSAWATAPPMEEVDTNDVNGSWATPPDAGKIGGSEKDLKKREKDLKKKEKELAKKEEELRSLEQQLRTQAGTVTAEQKNFPRCYPIVRHDIAADIPADFKRTVQAAWICFWAFFAASIVNLVGAIVALCAIGTKEGRLPGMFLALIYFIAGVPLAWITWYKTLYRAAASDKALGFAGFFITFLAHFVFIIWSFVGPDILVSQWSHTGVLSTISAFDKNTATGIMYLIGTVFWGFVILISLVVLKMVYTRFRGRSVGSLKQEMVQTLSTRV